MANSPAAYAPLSVSNLRLRELLEREIYFQLWFILLKKKRENRGEERRGEERRGEKEAGDNDQ
jgi:hypothetical protein